MKALYDGRMHPRAWRVTMALQLLLGLAACGDKVGNAPAPVAPPPVAAPQPAAAGPAFTLVASKGVVEVRRGQGGPWATAQVGDRLSQSDAVRTNDDGEADLQSDSVKIRVQQRSHFTVKTLNEKLVRAQLTGRMESDVAEGQAALEVESESSKAVARSEGGRFTVVSDRRGVVAVASVTGSVDLSSAGKSVKVNAGEVSHSKPGVAPTAAKKALRKVLLAVDWPGQTETRERTFKVGGKVEPGTQVSVGDQVVDVAPDGSFEADVQLRRGKQKLAVTAVDVAGRKKVVTSTVTVDDRAPDVRVTREKLWGR
jgi:hypothetical protein